MKSSQDQRAEAPPKTGRHRSRELDNQHFGGEGTLGAWVVMVSSTAVESVNSEWAGFGNFLNGVLLHSYLLV